MMKHDKNETNPKFSKSIENINVSIFVLNDMFFCSRTNPTLETDAKNVKNEIFKKNQNNKSI